MNIHDHLKSASMLKGQYYQDLMEDVGGGYCGAFEDGAKNTYRPNNEIAKTDKEQQYNEIMMVHNLTEMKKAKNHDGSLLH